MANPITWQNVTSNVGAGVGNFMDSARQGINDGFGAFNKVLAQRQAEQNANWDNQAKNNTQALYDALSQAKTPEEYQAMQASPEFQAQKQAMGMQYDQAKIREFGDNRNTVLQQRVLANDAFANNQTDLAQKPEIERLQTEMASVDPVRRAIARSDFEAGVFRNKGAVGQALDKQINDRLIQDRATEKFASDMTTAKSTRENQVVMGNAATSNALTNATEAVNRTTALQISKAKEKADADRASFKVIKSGTILEDGDLTNSDGQKVFMKAITDAKLGTAETQDLMDNLAKYAPGGMYETTDKNGKPLLLPVPASKAIEALRGSSENWAAIPIPGWSRRGDDFSNKLGALMKNPDTQDQIQLVNMKTRAFMETLRKEGNTSTDANAPSQSLPPGGVVAAPAALASVTPLEQAAAKAAPVASASRTDIMQQMAKESDEMGMGVRKEYSPEVLSLLAGDKLAKDKEKAAGQQSYMEKQLKQELSKTRGLSAQAMDVKKKP